MALTRRKILLGGSACFAAGLGFSIRVCAESPAIAALGRSELIYLSPVQTKSQIPYAYPSM